MTHEEKIKKVMNELGLNRTDAIEQVHFLDWTVAESDFLMEIYPKFKVDVDPNASFIKMCYVIWSDRQTGEREAYLSTVTSPDNNSK